MSPASDVDRITEVSAFILETDLTPATLTIGLQQRSILDPCITRKVFFSALQFICLFLDDFNLSIQHELLAFDLESLLCQVLQLSVKVTTHLRVLCLQQVDVLVTGLLIIVQTAYSRLGRVLDNFLSQDLKLEFHEVDLLLQVDDVLVSVIHVWVSSEDTWHRSALLLPIELHFTHRVVTRWVTECHMRLAAESLAFA